MSFDPNRTANLFIVPEGANESPRTPRTSPIAKSQSDAERIASARARAIASSKESNAHPIYSFDYPQSHWQDFAGSETSSWDAGVLVCIANILETPILKNGPNAWQPEHQYDRTTGMFHFSDAPSVSIKELKDAIDARIAELGLSKVKIWEWYADVREPIGHEWWRSDLETRIKKFKG